MLQYRIRENHFEIIPLTSCAATASRSVQPFTTDRKVMVSTASSIVRKILFYSMKNEVKKKVGYSMNSKSIQYCLNDRKFILLHSVPHPSKMEEFIQKKSSSNTKIMKTMGGTKDSIDTMKQIMKCSSLA